MTAVEQALTEMERRRCAAIGSADVAALKEVLSADYVHVHMTGKIDDLAGHIEAITLRPRTPERGPLSIRCYGDAAVIIGEQTNRVDGKVTLGIAQQVAIRQNGRWQFVSAQMTERLKVHRFGSLSQNSMSGATNSFGRSSVKNNRASSISTTRFAPGMVSFSQ
jgi:hypothetical protein